MSNVKVAVRVRPFNSREKGMNAELCIGMNGPQTMIYDLTKKSDNERKFTFDYSFWSFDSFKTCPTTGMLIQETPGNKYSGQNEVFAVLGKEVLDNAWEGYHCCLFAYGQTGAGKSYSMMGYPPDVGIVPMACEEMFKRVAENTDPNKRFEVYVSMLEVYNECVYDLLVKKVNKDGKGLDIRESTVEGIFVQGLTKVAVNDFKSIEAQIERGTSNRSVGATLMNATSSRAHTVTQIRFEQVTTREGGKEGRKVSVINLVDLAGSEKNDQTGATGDRLKEATNINKSLSTLGNVISALADLSEGKKKPGSIVVPYRDSKLTRLLQNALGGSSKTIMICAVSPASVNYEESLSTLRYADRAKQIKNAAIINEDPTEKRLRELTEENEKLKKLLAEGGISTTGGGAANEEAAAELAALEEEMRLMSMSFEERLKAAEQAAREDAAAQALLHAVSNTSDALELWAKIPHLYGLNADPQLNGRLRYELDTSSERRKSMVGRPPRAILENPSDEDEIDIPSGALGVLPKHCSVSMKDKTTPTLKLEDPQAVVFLNGNRVTDPIDLKSGDVIVIGETLAMTLKVYVPPANPSVASLTEAMRGDFDAYHAAIDAVSAVSPSEDAASIERRNELQARLAAAEAAAAKAESDARKKEEELEKKLKELAESGANGTLDMTILEEAKRKAAEEAELRLREKLAMEEEARVDATRRQAEAKIDALQREVGLECAEANAIAKDLNLPYVCRAVKICPPGFDATAPEALNQAVRVVVKFKGVDIGEWTPEQMDGRLFLMRDLHATLDGKTDAEKAEYVAMQLSPEKDPWWDPVDPDRRLGSAWIDLALLANGFHPVTGSFPVICPGGGPEGGDEVVCKIEARIEMAKCNGKENSTDAVDADKYAKYLPDLKEKGYVALAEKDLAFRVAFKKLTNVSQAYTGLNVRYEWAMSGVETLVNMDRNAGTRDTQGCVTLNHVKKFEHEDMSKRTAYWIIGEQDFKTKKFLGGKLRVDVYGECISSTRAALERERMFSGSTDAKKSGSCCVIM